MLSPTVVTPLRWSPPLVARTVPWAQVLPVLGLAVAPTAITAVRGGSAYEGALVAWLVVAGAVAGYAFDEPARAVSDPASVTTARRTAWRLGILAACLACCGLVMVAMVLARHGTGLDRLRDRAAVAVAVAAVSTGAAAVAHRGGADRVPAGSIAAGPLTVLVISSLSQRYAWLPTITDDRLTHRWWYLAAAGAALTAWNARDPYRR